jgi:hypothetical protein
VAGNKAKHSERDGDGPSPGRNGGRTARRRARRLARSFYGQALTAAEAHDLPAAQEMSGLDEEIAVLRLKLRSALEERPEDTKLMLRGVELLVRAASAKYRLSKTDEADLAEGVRGVLRDIGGPLYPEAFDDVA